MKKRLLCAIALMALVLSSCGNASAKDEPGYGKWRNSDLVGSIKADEEIRLQDDFAAAANQAVMAGAKPGSGTLERVKKEARALRASRAYKIGRFITFIPRKARAGWHHLKNTWLSIFHL